MATPYTIPGALPLLVDGSEGLVGEWFLSQSVQVIWYGFDGCLVIVGGYVLPSRHGYDRGWKRNLRRFGLGLNRVSDWIEICRHFRRTEFSTIIETDNRDRRRAPNRAYIRMTKLITTFRDFIYIYIYIYIIRAAILSQRPFDSPRTKDNTPFACSSLV